MLLVGGYLAVRTDQVRGYTDGADHDPAHDRWRRIAPSPPLAGSLVAQDVVWAGDRLLVWSDWERVRRQGNQLESAGVERQLGTERPRRARLPARGRRGLGRQQGSLGPAAPSPWGGLANNAAVWTGRAALFWGGETSPGGGPGIGLAFTPGQ
jgi:hypothetical protein